MKAVIREHTLTLLPPKPDVCQKCAVDHPPEYPHNQQSMYWHVWFKKEYGRAPTWSDAMEHCDPVMKGLWIEALAKRNIVITPTGECLDEKRN